MRIARYARYCTRGQVAGFSVTYYGIREEELVGDFEQKTLRIRAEQSVAGGFRVRLRLFSLINHLFLRKRNLLQF